MKRVTVSFVITCVLIGSVQIQAHTADDPMAVVLYAGQTQAVGWLYVWNDADYLYVKFDTTEANWYMLETHVHVATDPSLIPQTKKGNPIPGQFDYGSLHSPPVLERLYQIPMQWETGTSVCIAAHAAQCIPMEMWVYSDGTETFTAYSGPGSTLTDTRTGTAVEAWNHPNWDSVTAQFDYGKWVWESYNCVNPIFGDVVDFTKNFDVPGLPGGGTLWITADNGFAAFLNGNPLLSDGLASGWRTSNLTETYVKTSGWNSVEFTPFLALGANTFRFETANEYMGPLDGQANGTTASNPGGLIYEARIAYYDDGETAWGDGPEFVSDRGWATYVCYTVQGIIPQEWPEGGTTTVAFEDLPILQGNDWDYNDWVADILVKAIYFGTPADKDLIAMEFTINPQVKLAGYTHVMHLDTAAFACAGTYDLYRDGTWVATGGYTAGSGIDVVLVPNTGTPPGQVKLILTFDPGCQFDFSAFDPYASYHGEDLFFDPYLVVKNTGEEIHQGDPRMLTVPTDWAWPAEGVAIWSKYPNVTSGNPPLFVPYWWEP